ncbi:hypothetical protein M514_27234 [Trichuris suis]|uniref:Uncharacterized protein n=1 Tax=Trichuris suis TaxID=68888 RepID=A0A085MTQ5_9BILA|nr:hypothetical protein M514_27234 [Trichuris suis]
MAFRDLCTARSHGLQALQPSPNPLTGRRAAGLALIPVLAATALGRRCQAPTPVVLAYWEAGRGSGANPGPGRHCARPSMSGSHANPEVVLSRRCRVRAPMSFFGPRSLGCWCSYLWHITFGRCALLLTVSSSSSSRDS